MLRHDISIAFRLSAFSARLEVTVGAQRRQAISIAFRLSAFSAHDYSGWYYKMNGDGISIAFRLSAFSAQRGPHRRPVLRLGSQLPFGSVPFRHDTIMSTKVTKREAVSQLPFGSVPFRHGRRVRRRSHKRRVHLNCLSAQCLFGTPRT